MLTELQAERSGSAYSADQALMSAARVRLIGRRFESQLYEIILATIGIIDNPYVSSYC